MAIDEIDGETIDNTTCTADLNNITNAANNTELNKEKSSKNNSENDKINNMECSVEDIIVLETDKTSDVIVIIDDDDNGEKNLDKSENTYLVRKKILSRVPLNGSSASPDDIEENLEVTPSIRQYGRKAKKNIPDGSSLRKSIISPVIRVQGEHNAKVNKKNDVLTKRNDRKHDGLKSLEEIPEFTLKITNEPEKQDVLPVNPSARKETLCLKNKVIENKNSPVHNIEEIRQSNQEVHEENCNKRGTQEVQQAERSDNIEFYLNKIFRNNEDTQPLPAVVKMNNIPIIISENGVVTVIYKPEKVKLRRTMENLDPETSDKRSPNEPRAKRRKKKKNNENCSYARAKPRQKKNISKNTVENPEHSLKNVQKEQITRMKREKRRYPPLHKVKFEGQWVYKCKHCDFMHPHAVTALRRHMLRHQPEESIEWFYCDLCEYRAKRKGNLKIHMILHRSADDIVWYKCETCDKKFKHRTSLKAHEKRHFLREKLEQYMCDQCSYKTPYKHTLFRHKINHEPPDKKKLLKCNQCSYFTYNKYYFSRHKKNTHREALYKCLLCTYDAKFKANLESHMKIHFPQEEILYCDSCYFSTNRRYTLTLHNRKVHKFYNREQILFCYNCSFETRFKRCLVKHMSIHSGVAGSRDMVTRIKTEIT